MCVHSTERIDSTMSSHIYHKKDFQSHYQCSQTDIFTILARDRLNDRTDNIHVSHNDQSSHLLGARSIQ